MTTKTKTEVAAALGISKRRLFQILKDKTTDKQVAEKLAEHLGGTPAHYFREASRRGRKKCPANSVHHFYEFVRSTNNEVFRERSPRTPIEKLVNRLRNWMIFDAAGIRHFESLEVLLSYMRAKKFTIEERDLAPALWQQFRLWREYQIYLEKVFDIEMEGDCA